MKVHTQVLEQGQPKVETQKLHLKMHRNTGNHVFSANAEITEFAQRASKPEIDPQNQNKVRRTCNRRIWLAVPVQ